MGLESLGPEVHLNCGQEGEAREHPLRLSGCSVDNNKKDHHSKMPACMDINYFLIVKEYSTLIKTCISCHAKGKINN